jgi:multidrug efflux pump subunit AcrA (membrane-fusion protein)
VLVAAALALAACSEVESNVREVYPYKVEPIEGRNVKRVSMADETAALLPVRTATVQRQGSRKVVPHQALIYNPAGGAFVYTKPKAETYVRARVKIVRVSGGRVVLSGGPPVGTRVVTTGSAELLATEYEILNQHP